MSVDTLFLRRLQDHVRDKLLSEPLLNYVAITMFRNQVNLELTKRTAPHIAGRNGKVGSGIMINLPSADPTDDDIPGAQMNMNLALDILNKDDLAFGSIGSQLTAEDVVSITWFLLHQFMDQYTGSGNWYVSGVDPIEDSKGAYGYRLVLTVRGANDQPAKCANVLAAIAAGSATLTCATAGATIYYTLDGTFPGPGNAAAVQYAAPFAVVSGQTLLTAAYKNNYIGSDVWASTIP